ncbi:hypothetical protein MNL09_03800 [Bartonella krasnovii]|nr:hypothetical protein MNL09_03800 [Bartonella krasnovii]
MTALVFMQMLMFYDNAHLSYNAWVFNMQGFMEMQNYRVYARIHSNAVVYDDAVVSGAAKIYGKVYGNASVGSHTDVYGSVYGNAKISDYIVIRGNVYGNARIKDIAVYVRFP